MHLSTSSRLQIAALLSLGAVACGSSSSPTTPTTTVTTQDGNGTTSTTTTEGNTTVSNAVINSKASSSKMAKQSSDNVDEQADLSETASTGVDDGGGTRAVPKRPSVNFGFAASANIVGATFDANLHFQGNASGRGTLNGNAQVHVAPRAMPPSGHTDDANLNLVLTLDNNWTLSNNDVISVVTEPNLVITKSGTRASGKVIRTLNGTVHRSLVSAVDSNNNFDLLITHDGTVVTDTYAGANANAALSSRVTDGNTTVTNNLTQESAEITFNGLTRGKPGTCLCPTGGSVVLTVTGSDKTVTVHTYDFTGVCGASTVDVTGSASAMLKAASTSSTTGTTATTAAGEATTVTTTSTAANPNGTASSSAHVHGELSWEDCIPAATSN